MTTSEAVVPAFKPPLHVKFAYGLGQAVQSGGFDVALPFTFFYYTQVLGLSGVLTGVAVGLSLCLDAIMDPLVGSISDNIRSKFGRRLPLMVISIPLVALGFGLIFSPPRDIAQPLLFAWLLGASLIARGATSLFNVPFIALGAELSDGYLERSRVVVWRTLIGLFSAIGIILLAYRVYLTPPEGLFKLAAYPPFGWAVAAVLVVCMAACCAGVARYAMGLPQTQTTERSMLSRLPGEVREIFSNHSFRTLFLSCLLIMVAIGVNGTTGAHNNTYVWRIGTKEIELLTFVLLVGTLIGVPTAPALARWFEKRSVVMIGVTMLNLVWLTAPLLWISGLYRPSGAAAIPMLMGMMIVAGVGIGLVLVAFPAMMADAADEHELRFGHRREGLYFSGITFAAKAASGVGVLLAGIGLDLMGMPAKADPLVPIDPDALIRLVMVHGPLAALISCIGVALIWPYRITRKVHDEISFKLRGR
ncbi:MAG: MFS transporter [Caulobacter sp.]|nr:MFS transporter [Caulobacter sp.]